MRGGRNVAAVMLFLIGAVVSYAVTTAPEKGVVSSILSLYCFFSTSTKFAPDFSDSAFELIEEGDSINRVRSLIGDPLWKTHERRGKWVYSFAVPGRCYKLRQVRFSSEGVVSSKWSQLTIQ